MLQFGIGEQSNGGEGAHAGAPGQVGKPAYTVPGSQIGQLDRGASWNQALQSDNFWYEVFKSSHRPAIITSAVFFAAFVWLFVLYNVHRMDAANSEKSIKANQNFASAAEAKPTVAASNNAGLYGSPRTVAAMPVCAAPMTPVSAAYLAAPAAGTMPNPAAVPGRAYPAAIPAVVMTGSTFGGRVGYVATPHGACRLIVSR